VTGIDPLKVARELWKNTRLNGRSQNAIAAKIVANIIDK